MSDPRLRRDKAGRMPWQVASALGHAEMAAILRPGSDVHAVLANAGRVLRVMPLPTLAQLAGEALKEGLVASLGHAVQAAQQHGQKQDCQHACMQIHAAEDCSPKRMDEGQQEAFEVEEEVEEECGVCLSHAAGIALRGCGHALCSGCAGEMVQRMQPGTPLACPFCRGHVRGFGAMH